MDNLIKRLQDAGTKKINEGYEEYLRTKVNGYDLSLLWANEVDYIEYNGDGKFTVDGPIIISGGNLPEDAWDWQDPAEFQMQFDWNTGKVLSAEFLDIYPEYADALKPVLTNELAMVYAQKAVALAKKVVTDNGESSMDGVDLEDGEVSYMVSRMFYNDVKAGKIAGLGVGEDGFIEKRRINRNVAVASDSISPPKWVKDLETWNSAVASLRAHDALMKDGKPNYGAIIAIYKNKKKQKGEDVKEAAVICKKCGRGGFEGVDDEGKDVIKCSHCQKPESECNCKVLKEYSGSYGAV